MKSNRSAGRGAAVAGLALAASLALWVGQSACAGGGDVKTVMPGKTFSGALPPLTQAETELSRRLRAHVEKLGGEIGERNVFKPDKLEAAAVYIEGTFKQLGFEFGRQEFAAGGEKVRNIDATQSGASKPEEIIVIGAHYDSVRGAAGANDNATGVAAVLEVARLLKGEKLPRTIRYVAFVNEEPPFFQTQSMGSLVYAKRCRERNEKIVAMLTPETIGFYSDAAGSQRYPGLLAAAYPKTGNFIAFVGEIESAALVERCVESFRRHTQFPSEGGAAPGSIQGVDWSDHWSFQRQGYPALMLTDTAPFRYPHYHTEQDTPDKIDYDKTARVTAGLARVVRELARE